MKLRQAFGVLAATLALALGGGSVQAYVVYSNTNTDLGVNFNTGSLLIGDEITLAGSARYITNFQFQYYLLSPNGTEQMEVQFYQNNGPTNIDGTFDPGTVFFDSGKFNIAGTSRSTLDFDLTALETGNLMNLSPSTIAPDDFTFAIQIFNATNGADGGVSLYSPPTVGGDFYDYWQSNAVGGWTLMTNGTYPINIGAEIEAAPEPAPVALFGLGGLAVVGLALRRRMARQ